MHNYKLIAHENVKSPITEAYRTLRINLQFADAHGEALRTLMFTSAGPREGKSVTVANMAVVLAQSGKKVIISDCDLRKPAQHKIFGLNNRRGLTNALMEKIRVTELLQDSSIHNVRVLTSGPIPPDPFELLGGVKMEQVLQELKQACDLLLVDVPPVVAVTDASVLADKMDGVVLVISIGQDRPEMVQHAKDFLLQANTKLLGVVLNRVDLDQGHACYYDYCGADGSKRERMKRTKKATLTL